MHHIHHQIPPKYKIYLVGLPSVLYKTPGQNKRSILNQLVLILVLFIESAGFIQKVQLFMKTNKTMSICVYICTIYTYMHHHIPTKHDIPSWPSLCTLWKTRSKCETCVESDVFVVLQVLFSPFHVLFMKSTTFHTKSATFHENKQDQVNMCVYIYHQISPKYSIYLVGLSLCTLWKTRSKWETCVESAVCFAFQMFSMLFTYFSSKVPLFIWSCNCYKTNKIESICVYICTIYTYMHHMHHQLPPKYEICLVGLPSVLYERPSQNERSVLNLLFLLLFRCFSVLFM